MNKRDREQLRASIAKDLIEGQGEPSPTRELLRQYAPLEGIVSGPAAAEELRSRPVQPVEKSMAPRATVARDDSSAWHGATVERDATVAPHATVAGYAMVRGELRVPNTLNFTVFPTLDPFAKAVYYQLFLLSHGFKRDTCLVGLAKLSRSVLMSQRKVQNTIAYLEKRGLIKRIEPKLGGPSKGNLYLVPLPVASIAPDATVAHGATQAGGATVASHATIAPDATVARRANNKDDDKKNKSNHHQKSGKTALSGDPVENHSGAAAPREKQESAERHFALVRDAYEKATGNTWNDSDSAAYEENSLQRVPTEKIIPVLEAVARRTPGRVNSLAYFVKEIHALMAPRNRAWQKKQLEAIVRRIQDNSVGRAGYSTAEFVEDVKRACAREAVPFDNDIFNEMTG